MKRKMNNKGFSLVELIVVMAIMAILAVTLAPKLTHYVEKSRKAADQEVINTIYNATKLSLVDETLNKAYVDNATGTDHDSNASTPVTYPYSIALKATNIYTTTDGKTWQPDGTSNAFVEELKDVVGKFKLKSSGATTSTTIGISLASDGTITVTLDYNGGTYTSGDGYQITE